MILLVGASASGKSVVAKKLFEKYLERKKHEIEEKARRIQNANILQYLLDKEHRIRDEYNADNNTVFTTKEARRRAYVSGKTDYNGYGSLSNAGYRFK